MGAPEVLFAVRRGLFKASHFLVIALGFAAVRYYYLTRVGVRFEASSLVEYMQFIDPKLLRTDLLRSLFYLRDQPPLFNLFLGVGLKAFPTSYETAFQVAYLAMGLAAAFTSYALAKRLRAGSFASAVIALGLSSLPGTVLYENWLFYAYPLALLWLVAGLAMHRVLVSPSAKNAFLATGSLALIALMRGTIHAVVLVGVVLGLALVRRVEVRRILLGAAFPVALVVALYVKHAVVFRGIVIGGFYRGVNLSMMQMQELDPPDIARLEEAGILSPACPEYLHSHVDLNRLVQSARLPLPSVRGIPILDEPWKSTGATNWNSSAAEVMGEECSATAQALRGAEPGLYPQAVKGNATRYFAPADHTWPFLREDQGNNADRLRHLNKLADYGACCSKRDISVTVVVALVLLGVIPLVGLVRLAWKKRGQRRVSSALLVAIFSAGIVLYSSVVVVFSSVGDHNRYRAEVMPLVWVVVFAFLARGVRTGWRLLRLSRTTRSLY